MLKRYNTAADLLIAANAYVKKGNKRDGLKLALLAMENEDMEALIESIDAENTALDVTVNEEVAPVAEEKDEEVAVEEVVKEAEAPVAEEASDDGLPDIEDVVASVRRKRIQNRAALVRRPAEEKRRPSLRERLLARRK